MPIKRNNKDRPANWSPSFALAFILFFSINASADPNTDPSKENVLRVHFLSVGYADAILIELPNSETMLIDAGDREDALKIIKCLQKLRIKKIDYAIITHPHTNHFGGFSKIIDKFRVGRLFTNGETSGDAGYTKLLSKIEKQNILHQTLKAGDIISTDNPDLSIQILNPSGLLGSPNENSIVTYVRFGKTSFLFTADITQKQFGDIITLHPETKNSDVLQIPHHGDTLSDDATSLLKNKFFVISTGKNRWGIPKKSDLDKLNGKILRTDKDGIITLESDGDSVSIIKPQT